jgi:hypothetical protein
MAFSISMTGKKKKSQTAIFSITAFSISIDLHDTEHCDFIEVLSVVMLNILILNVTMLSVVVQNVKMLNVVILDECQYVQ